MLQSSTHSCSRCGSSIPANQRFCQNCGAPTGVAANNPANPGYEGDTFISAPPPPPPGTYARTQLAAPSAVRPEQAQQKFQQVPPYAQPQKNSTRGLFKRLGFGLVLLILLALVLCSATGYVGWKWITSRTATGTTSAGTQSNVSQPNITTTSINETVTYSSVMITIVNAQQSLRFANDSSTSSPGALRINLDERQSVPLDTGGDNTDPYYGYTDTFTLLLPGGNSVTSLDTKIANGPTGGTRQTNWIDFPVPTSIKVNQLTLRIGKSTEAQMDIPLTGHANLSAYQPETVNPNSHTQYGGMTWTLTTASAQLSDGGRQADKGMRYIVVAVSVDNPTSQDINAYSPDYVRLQVSNNQIAPEASTIAAFPAGTTGTKGVAAFLVPQDSTSFTLLLLPNISTGATSQATIHFQIQ
jgi:hypothetical protein